MIFRAKLRIDEGRIPKTALCDIEANSEYDAAYFARDYWVRNWKGALPGVDPVIFVFERFKDGSFDDYPTFSLIWDRKHLEHAIAERNRIEGKRGEVPAAPPPKKPAEIPWWRRGRTRGRPIHAIRHT